MARRRLASFGHVVGMSAAALLALSPGVDANSRGKSSPRKTELFSPYRVPRDTAQSRANRQAEDLLKEFHARRLDPSSYGRNSATDAMGELIEALRRSRPAADSRTGVIVRSSIPHSAARRVKLDAQLRLMGHNPDRWKLNGNDDAIEASIKILQKPVPGKEVIFASFLPDTRDFAVTRAVVALEAEKYYPVYADLLEDLLDQHRGHVMIVIGHTENGALVYRDGKSEQRIPIDELIHRAREKGVMALPLACDTAALGAPVGTLSGIGPEQVGVLIRELKTRKLKQVSDIVLAFESLAETSINPVAFSENYLYLSIVKDGVLITRIEIGDPTASSTTGFSNAGPLSSSVPSGQLDEVPDEDAWSLAFGTADDPEGIVAPEAATMTTMTRAEGDSLPGTANAAQTSYRTQDAASGDIDNGDEALTTSAVSVVATDGVSPTVPSPPFKARELGGALWPGALVLGSVGLWVWTFAWTRRKSTWQTRRSQRAVAATRVPILASGALVGMGALWFAVVHFYIVRWLLGIPLLVAAAFFLF